MRRTNYPLRPVAFLCHVVIASSLTEVSLAGRDFEKGKLRTNKSSNLQSYKKLYFLTNGINLSATMDPLQKFPINRQFSHDQNEVIHYFQ